MKRVVVASIIGGRWSGEVEDTMDRKWATMSDEVGRGEFRKVGGAIVSSRIETCCMKRGAGIQ